MVRRKPSQIFNCVRSAKSDKKNFLTFPDIMCHNICLFRTIFVINTYHHHQHHYYQHWWKHKLIAYCVRNTYCFWPNLAFCHHHCSPILLITCHCTQFHEKLCYSSSILVFIVVVRYRYEVFVAFLSLRILMRCGSLFMFDCLQHWKIPWANVFLYQMQFEDYIFIYESWFLISTISIIHLFGHCALMCFDAPRVVDL